MGYGKPQVVEDFMYTLNQCKHCGNWLNDKGYVDMTCNPKIKTVKGLYCKYCKTAAQRLAIDKENAELLEKHGGAK